MGASSVDFRLTCLTVNTVLCAFGMYEHLCQGLVAPENVHGHAKDPSAAASCDLTPMRQILDTFFRDPTTAPDSADTNREEDVGEDDWDDVEWEVNVEDGHLVEFDNAAQPASKTIRYRPFVSHNISVGWTAPDTKKRQ